MTENDPIGETKWEISFQYQHKRGMGEIYGFSLFSYIRKESWNNNEIMIPYGLATDKSWTDRTVLGITV